LNRGDWKLSYDQIGEMTIPQVLNAIHEGEIPKPGVKTFGSVMEARCWRMEQLEKVEARKAKAEADERRASVAGWRKARRGY
jgi:hypothetical protein